MLNSGVFFRILKDGENHLKYIREFVDTYDLPYSFSDDDSNEAPALLAKDGHLVVKTSWDYMNIVVFYVPELITDNQKSWLDTNLDSFKNYEYLGFNNYSLVDDEVIEERIEDLEKEVVEINKRYLNFRKSLGVEGRVIIVPDEEQIKDDVFEKIIVGNENHVDRYQDFSDKYHLGYEFSDNDSYIAPLTMASIGHFCYNTAESISNILMYIPEVVTERQYNYFVNNREMILNYVDKKATAVKDRDGNLVIETLDDFDLIEKEVNKRYGKYKKLKEEKGHVR